MASSEMRSRLLTLLLMASGAVALLLYARREDALNRPLPSTGLLYPGLDRSAITRLYISLRGGQDLQFEREPGSVWRITEPGAEYARQEFVDVILGNLVDAQVQPVEQANDTVRAEDVGLEPPKHIIRFGNGAREETLLLGEVEPLGRMVYARRQGHSNIVLATRNLVTLLQGNADDFVDTTLLRGLAGPVDMIRVVSPQGVRLDARRTGDRWTVLQPEPAMGDDGKLSTLVRALGFVRHDDVLISRPTRTQLHRLGLPDDEEIAQDILREATRIELGAPGEQPVVAWLESGWEDSPTDGVAARRAGSPKRHLLPPIAERAEALRFTRDGTTTLAIRRGKDGRWLFEEPAHLAGEPVEAERVAGHSVLGDLLSRLDAVEAIGFCEAPTAEPIAQMSVEWTRAGTTTTDRVRFFEPTPQGVPCTSSERPAEGLLVAESALQPFEPIQAELLRSTRPLEVDPEAWARLVIEHPGGAPWTLVRRDSDGQWEGDDEWARRIAVAHDMLRGPRGLRWEPARGGARHAFRVRFEEADGQVLADLALRRSEPDEELEVLGIPVVRASVAGRPGVELVVAREWIERIEELSRPPERMQDG
jgi:hypothetical protein